MRSLARWMALVGLLLAPLGHARLPALADGSEIAELPAGSTDIHLPMRYAKGARTIHQMLNDDDFWGDAEVKTYQGELYEEIRLKPMPDGFVPMIVGESDEDIPHDVVADIVFGQMTNLPRYMEGAKVVETLGTGIDPEYGVPYVDSFFALDMSFLYVIYPQRMYRKTVDGVSYMWFEKLDPSFVDAETWAAYSKQIDAIIEREKWRTFFGGRVEPAQVFGVFIVDKGAVRESRVTFVSKLVFGSDAGFIANFGSKLRPVIRAGLQSGFDASVKIAKAERDRRQG